MRESVYSRATAVALMEKCEAKLKRTNELTGQLTIQHSPNASLWV